MATMDNDAALRSLNLLNFANIPGLQPSPEKFASLDEFVQNVMSNSQNLGAMPDLSASDSTSKAVSSSSGSVSPSREEGSEEPDINESQTTTVPRRYTQEPWYECFSTSKEPEFNALIYSVYVMKKDDKKLDGCEYYECINRLQSKCRYKVRTKKVNEFWVVEEKGAHNHAMEPVGSPGSHAGLPKTLREIVDQSFYEEWANSLRQQKIEEEVKRLGLPHNPRLGRQVDNRIAYLRRVKNLQETRKISELVDGGQGFQQVRENNTTDDVMQLILKMTQTGNIPEEVLAQLNQDNLAAQMAIPPQMQHLPPVSQPQIIVHENNNEIMKFLSQQNKQEPVADQAILNMLNQYSQIPPVSSYPMPMDTQDSSSSSSPEDRLQIED